MNFMYYNFNHNNHREIILLNYTCKLSKQFESRSGPPHMGPELNPSCMQISVMVFGQGKNMSPDQYLDKYQDFNFKY